MDYSAEDTFVALGESVKSLGEFQENGKTYAKVGGHLVLFGSDNLKDLTGQWFSPKTYYGKYEGDGADVMVHHGAQIKTGDPDIDYEMSQYNRKLLAPMRTRRDPLGIWAETVLDLSDRYQKAVYGLAQKGALMWSSGTASHMIKASPTTGEIEQWPIIEGSLTPTPAEARMLGHRVLPLKALLGFDEGSAGDDSNGRGGSDGHASWKSSMTRRQSLNNGVKCMNLIEAIKKLVPGLSSQQIQALGAVLSLSGVATESGGEDAGLGDTGMSEGETPATPASDSSWEAPMTPGEESKPGEDEEEKKGMGTRSIDINVLKKQLQEMGFATGNPGPRKAITRPVYRDENTQSPVKAFDAVYLKRFGEEDAGKKAILQEVIGHDYRQQIYEQTVAFNKYLRRGESGLSRDEYRALKTMYFPMGAIVQMATEMDITAVKATMVQAQGELGGFAVPPNYQTEISTRLPGLTAVRQAGARVVTLTNSNAIEIPLYAGGDTRYRGALRGEWGSGETPTPNEKNAKLGMVTVTAEIYTYKVPMSQSMVEDAANLASLVQSDISDVLALDEDSAFLVGTGVGQPLGILPGGANKMSLKEVASGHASTITGDGIKQQKRGVATQYRPRGIWVGNSDTFSTIETIKDTTGNYMFPDLSDQDMLLDRKAYESGAMPDVASLTYPLLFGDMSGYTIVERLGLTIQRFQDSNTGPNRVEYHVRRRLGGRVEQPWKFALLKIAASL